MYSHYLKLAPAEEVNTVFNSKNKHAKTCFWFSFLGGTRQRNVQRFITHVQNYCFAYDVLVAVAVVFCRCALRTNTLFSCLESRASCYKQETFGSGLP